MKTILTFILFCLCFYVSAQTTIEEVLNLLEEQSPESVIIRLNRGTTDLNQQNISHAWRPQLGFTAQSTYQSDVTSFNAEVPGIDIPSVDQFQYKAQAEVSQLIYDGGSISAVKDAVRMQGQIEETRSLMNLDQIKGEVIGLYFSILESEQVLKSIELQAEVLEARRSILQAGVENGVVLESELSELDAALLQLEQEVAKILNMRRTAIQALSIIVGQDFSLGATFIQPAVDMNSEEKSGDLLFHKLLNQQSLALDAKKKIDDTKSKPQIAGFGQLGLGRPGLNFLDNSLSEYYIVGLRLNWKFSNLYSKANDRQVLLLNKEKINAQKEMYDRNWRAAEVQFKNHIEVQEDLIEVNNTLVELRSTISEVAKAQLDNGVINTADYISKINDEYTARINLEMAKIRRLKSQYQLIHHYNLLP
ncbi:MAG: TolC family protein [Saprospiraceae bacterium]|nr:TolC family protein [Saprospiraceae bacterium]